MKRPTILRDLIFVVLMMLVSCANYSQKLIAFNDTFDNNLSENTFFKTNKLAIGAFSTTNSTEPIKDRSIVAELENPVIPYAQLPYAGQVTRCPNDGKDLPKLFLCGGNDSRLIDTKITDARSITWEKFISGGGCATVANSDCANETAGASCWAQLATGQDYLANSAGQYRVKITDSTGKPYVFYFNVYQNTLIPTAITKSDIIKNAAGNCQISGKISVGGFGNGYEYSFTTTGTPGIWQDSNVFTTTIPGNYTAFIRIKGVIGSCEFKVIDLSIKEVNFVVTTVVTSPKCYDGKGSIEVKTNDIKQQYTYKIFNTGSTTLLATKGPTLDPSYTFTGLSAGSYKIETSVSGSNCMVDTKTDVKIVSAPGQLSANANITTALTSCSTGVITMESTSGGVKPYKYFVNINSAGFVLNADNKIRTVQSGTYIIRMEDANGCTLDKTVNVPVVDKPIYKANKTDPPCGRSDGTIVFDVTNANGYTIEYSINNGTDYLPTNTFNNLSAGIYNTKIRYKKGTSTTWCTNPSEEVVIGASTALSASAGIAELSGCGPAGKELQGMVRITNPQGGVPFAAPNLYRYSFDNKATWVTSNQAYIDPVQNLTVYIKDALDCEFAMGGISLDKKPDAPEIKVGDPVFNCDGSATTTVTVINSGVGNTKFSYKYYIDGKANVPIDSNVFLNVTQGDHTITVNYTVLTVPTYSNLLNEDFGSGDDTTSPGINTTYYCWERQVVATQCNGNNAINDGDYTVTSNIVKPFATWINPVDHTSGTRVGKGRYLAVNIGATIPKTANLYLKEINDVIPYQDITVEIYAINLLRDNKEFDPNLQLALLDKAGNIISDKATGDILKTNKWEKYVLTLNPGNNTKLDFVVRSFVQQTGGNDVGIDDIKVFQIPKTCGATASFPTFVDGSKAFSAGITGYKDIQCNGDKNGEITISAKNFNPTKGFQYTLDGTTWITVIPSPASTSGSVTLTGLNSGVYNINIRYDNSTGSCNFPVKQEIKIPTALKIEAKVTKLATCIFGATITAVATEGTPGYQYQLLAADGSIFRAFQASGEFSNVPAGNYTVVAKDLNLCSTAVPAPVTVVAVIASPTATIDPNSNICFTNKDGASIKVNISGGKGPFNYKVSRDGGVTYGDLSATFTDPTFTHTALTTGTYDFIIVDANSCEATVVSQKIDPQFGATPGIKAALSCKPGATAATIEVTIDGGTAPYDYIVKNSLDTEIATGNTTTTKFEYSTNISDTYTFEIKDKNGCPLIIKQKVSDLVQVTAKDSPKPATCFGADNGYVDLEGVTGKAPYTFEFNGIGGFSDKTRYDNLAGSVAGIEYSYTVKDANDCVKTYTFKIYQPEEVSGIAEITTPYTCDGSATITVSDVKGGNGTYKYTLNKNGVAGVPQNSKVFNGITEAGSYTVTITDSNGCSFTTKPALSIVTLNPPLNLAFSERPISCKPLELSSQVTVSITAGTGTPALKYEITAPAVAITNVSGATTGVFTGLTAGTTGTTYYFKVTDANNCFATGTYTVKPVVPIVVTASLVSNVKCFGDSNGAVDYTISGLGNDVNYSYTIDGGTVVTGTTPAAPATTTFVVNSTGLLAGPHSLVITDLGSTCTGTNKPITVNAPAKLVINTPTITPITCSPNKGKVVINSTGGWGNNKYTLTQPDLTVVGPQSSATFYNLTQSGTYSISVTDLDGDGCTVTATFDMDAKVVPSAKIDVTSDLCYDAIGMATIIVTPTVAPQPNPDYEYSINAGVSYQPSGTFDKLIPGKYTIRVRDKVTGCSIDLAEQTIATQLTASLNLKSGPKCNSATIQIDGTVNGGTPVYKYKVTINGDITLDPTEYTVTGNTFTYTNNVAVTATTATTYLFTFTDDVDCTTTLTEVVEAKIPPKFTATPNSTIFCSGQNTGSITVDIDAAFGVAPYVINVVKDNSLLTLPTTPNVDYGTKTTGLPAGTYIVTVTDANGCSTVLKDILITEPDPIVIDFKKEDLSCTGVGITKGKIIINGVTGGTKNYDYYVTGTNNYNEENLNNQGTIVVFEIVNFGLYQIRVVDKNTCQEVINDVLIAAPVNDLKIDIETVATCTTGGTANVIINSAFASDGPFYFSIYHGILPTYIPGIAGNEAADTAAGWQKETAFESKMAIFTGLLPGVTYSFIVYDSATKCYHFQAATTPIPTVSDLVLDNVVGNNITCSDADDASVSFDVINNYSQDVKVSYQVYEALSNLPITGLSGNNIDIIQGETFVVTNLGGAGLLRVGTYYVLVTENVGPNAGCGVVSANFNIKKSPVALVLDASSSKNENCKTQGIIEAFAQGGTIIAEDPLATPPITAVPYLYQIFDDKGTPGGIDALLDIAPTAASFTVALHSSNTFNKGAGHYIVYVRDAYGCIQFKFVEVKLDPSPVITASVSNQCTATEGIFSIDVAFTTVGTGQHKYSLNGGEFKLTPATAFTISNVSSGTHTVKIKDANDCGNEVIDIIIVAPLEINASFTGTLPTCEQANGTITVVVTGGSLAPPSPTNHFKYTLKNNKVVPVIADIVQFDDPVFLNQAAGNYTVTVEDLVTMCTKSYTLDLLIPTAVDLLDTDIDTTPVDCTAPQGTNNNGTITVNLSAVNDNPDYTYALSGAATRAAQPSNVFTGLAPGSYNVTVTSGRSCSATVNAVIIAEPAVVTASVNVTPFSCTIDPTKTTAVVTGGGGTGTYSFSANGTDYFISNSLPTPDNKYTFDLADTGAAQNLTYYVKDSNGCIQVSTATTLNSLPKLISATASLVTLADCANAGTETIYVAIVGGATPYNFEYQVSIDGGAYSTLATAVTAGVNSFNYTAFNAAGHKYQFKIKDLTTGCDIVSNVYDVPVFNKIKVYATPAANVDCNTNKNGAIEINITGYSGTYDYVIYDGVTAVVGASGSHDTATSNPFVIPFGLGAGKDYTVRVLETDFPSCPATSDVVEITEPDVLTLGTAITVVNKNCFTPNGAKVTVPITSIVGGTPGYTYAFVPKGASPTGLFIPFNTTTLQTTKISPDFDEWDVYVQDANLCQAVQTIKITTDPIPTVTATATAQCVSPYTIEAVGIGVGTLEYSLDGNSFDTSTTLTVNSPGNHTVWVRDANQCTNTTAVPVTIFEPLELGYDTTATSICNGNEGEVTLRASGGSGAANYEYSNDGIGYSSVAGANVFGGLTPRATAYTFYVKDKVTNCVTPVNVTIELPNTVIDFTLDPKNVICNGGSTGSITVNMDTATTTVNNNPVYTYAITPSPVGMVLVDNVFTNLPKGTYIVTVTSGKGCPVPKTIDVNEPDAIVVAAPQVTPYDCTAGNIMNNATITVALPTGGSGTYMVYEFLRNGNPVAVQRGDNPVYIESDLLGGSYVINVYDDKGCRGQITAIIDAFVGIDFDPAAAITIDDPITCVNLEDIQVNAVFTSGLAVTLDYTIVSTVDNPTLGIKGNAIPYPTTTNQSGTFIDLTVGSYTITVTNPITKCSIKTIHYVNEPNTFSLVTSNIKNVACFGTATGSADITLIDNQPIPDNAGPFEYTITGPAGTSALQTSATVNVSLQNLVAGDYVVNATLSGLPSCSVETKFSIAQSSAALQINVVSTPITCDPGNDGTITVSAVDGWPGVYLYELIDVTTGANSVAYSDQFYFDNLTPGDYIVNVKDSNKCVDSQTITLKNPDPIVVTANATATTLDCFGGSNGEIIVDLPTGGQGTNYSYILNNVSAIPAFSTQPQSSPVFSGLPAGTYTVTVIDGFSCISNSTADIILVDPTKVETTLTLETGKTCQSPATLRLSATGGTGSYEYSSNANFIPATPFTSSTVITAAIGDNQFYVRDTKGCKSTISDNVTINELTPLTIEVIDSNPIIYCKGDASASIDAVAKGGLGNYTYSLEDDLGNPIRGDQADGYFDKLPQGKYVVKVKSGIDCFDSKAIDITEPLTELVATPTVTPVSCFGENTGKIIINASGGTGKIQYAISPNLDQFDTINTFERLSAGKYIIIVQDDNGCYIPLDIVILQPPILYATEIVTERVEVLCADDTTGAFSILIRGGVGPYTAKLDDKNIVPVVLDRVDYTGLSGGTHIVYITDANNCTSEFEVIMNSGVVLDPKVEVTYECGADNTQANQVEVTIDPSNTDATLVQYELDGDPLTNQASNVFINVAPGVHTITAIHANGCFKFSEDFTVRSFAPLTLVLSAGLPEMNVISVTAGGGRASYEYSFNGEPFTTSSTYKIYKTGDYEVIVRDQNGCTASIMVPMVYIDVCIPNYFTPNGDGVYDQWGPGCTNIYNNLKFEIFDRYGRSVAKLRYGQKWDGKYHGEELPTGDYWYVLKLNDKKDDRDFVGHFTLYR